MEDVLILSISCLFLILGFIGSLLPIVPGPIMSYIGLLIVHFFTDFKFTNSEIILYAGITCIVFFSDYLLQFVGIKKFGGGKNAVYGTMIGIVVGLFFPPIGLILGPFIGAFLGSLMDNKEQGQAIGIAFGALIGFIFGTLIKLIFSIYIIYLVVEKLVYLS